MSTTQNLSRLLPLPVDELQQVIDYAATLSKQEAADHFRNLLGDSPEAVDFIASFNSKRQTPAAGFSTPPSDPVPKSKRGASKKKAPLHTPTPRRIVDSGPLPGTAYNKKDLDNDYVARRPSPALPPTTAALSVKTSQQKVTTPAPASRAHALTAGRLISDPPPSKPRSNPASRSSTPGPKTKVNISGGTAMHGASTALTDLDDAIRALEMTTNPAQVTDASLRRCNCVAARHPLLASAPNCLNCGKVICVKEGLGPCSFCGTALLTPSEVQSMIRELRDERGREKMALDRQAHRKAEVSKTPAPFSRPRDALDTMTDAEAKALEHRDRLLGFQAQNARRTTVKDEAADFDVSSAVAGNGGNMWASPEERARELKRQQKILREMEWNARPDYEKRRQVVSIDLVGGKVVRKMTAMERPASPDEEMTPDFSDSSLGETSGNRAGSQKGAFSKNPLLGGLIKPVFHSKGQAEEGRQLNAKRWRRVQDDLYDNEAVILDGGIFGQSDSIKVE
ncbi:zf-C2HC5-domain-containing protein [Xylariaceae sp. FL0255]|nr:zf-C2HC5-domain-containing protein [Xylariaceae sp. FL0255]